MSIYSQISANKTKSYVIMTGFVLFIVFLAWVIGQIYGSGEIVVLLALILSVATSIGSYYYSDKIVLGLAGARELQNTAGRDVYDLVQNMAIASGLPMPKVFVIDDPAPNAFATGRDPQHATVCFTTGILGMLDKLELEGVVAHEMSHIKNFDTLLMTIVSILVGMVSIIAEIFMRSRFRGKSGKGSELGALILVFGIVMVVLSPLVATIIQLAISRKREFLADASAALATRYPAGLANALEKISSVDMKMMSVDRSMAHLFIINPLGNKKSKNFLDKLFSTHPPIEERVKILRSM